MYVKQGKKFNINVDISPEWIAERIIVMSLSRKCIDHAFSAWPVNLPRRDANEGAEQCSADAGWVQFSNPRTTCSLLLGCPIVFATSDDPEIMKFCKWAKFCQIRSFFLFQSLGEPDLRFPSPPTKGCSALHCLSCLHVNDERRSLARSLAGRTNVAGPLFR